MPIVCMLFTIGSRMTERFSAHIGRNFFVNPFLEREESLLISRFFRMQIALVRHLLLVMCLYSVLDRAFDKPELGHQVDIRKAADTPITEDNRAKRVCLNQTNMQCRSACISTRKHAFFPFCSTDTKK